MGFVLRCLSSYLSSPLSALLQAKAVERMREKCQQETTTIVSEATISMMRNLKKSQRGEAALQSQLSKAQVPPPLTYHAIVTLNRNGSS